MDVKPIPLTPPRGGSDPSADLARTQAMEKAEREFHAMLLREMLRPLTQALFGSENGVSADATPLASGNETYAYFLEQALSQQLAQGWPLPNPFGEASSPASADQLPGAALDLRLNAMREARSTPLPISVRNAAIPLAPAAQPGVKAPISIDPVARTSRLPASLVPSESATRYSRSGSAPIISADPRTQEAPAASAARSTASRVGVELPDAEIRRASRLFDLPENLVRAVVLTESGGRASAISPKGAVGYMQVMPSTGKEMGASNLRDTWQNIYAGAKYLRKQLDRFGNLEHALAAYNAGPGAVERHGGIPPYRETRNYVQRVVSWMDRLDRSGS